MPKGKGGPHNYGGKGGRNTAGKGGDLNNPAPIPQSKRPPVAQVATGKTTTKSMKPGIRSRGA